MKIEMFLLIAASVVLNVLGQKLPDFLEKQDPEYEDYKSKGLDQEDQYKDQNSFDHQTEEPEYTVNLAVFDELDSQLEKHNKFAEFKEFSDQLKEKAEMDPSRTVQDEVKEVLQWARNLDRPQTYKSNPQTQQWGNIDRNFDTRPPRPSPGMSEYWPEQKQSVLRAPVAPETSSDKVNEMSLIESIPEAYKNLPNSLSGKNTTNVLMSMQEMDDYNSPIRWVPLDSNDTTDGLAKVTNINTGKNQQYILNGTIFVPVIDYNIARLGLTSTTHRPLITTDNGMLLTVARSIDFKNVDKRDWLAFESANRNENQQCEGDGCQSRCKTLACESVCRGDTCGSGCIGGFCNTYCKGHGCLSMCIGESCTAKCEGMSCEARCRGTGCVAGCRTFSCTYTINGRYGRGGGAYGEHYPQYDEKNIKNTEYY